LEQAAALCVELKPILAEMLERNDPAVKNLTFNDIESNAAAVGDLLAKLMMRRALAQQPAVTAAEEIAARQAVLHKVLRKKKLNPEELQMTHIKQRRRKLKTARGAITFKRDYLYFPELETGIFPPRS
jgi:pyridoxal/pyridoxine/pyridoxamine kinase